MVLGREVAALDALRERDLLVRGQQRRLRDAVEELLQRVERRVRALWGVKVSVATIASYGRVLRTT